MMGDIAGIFHWSPAIMDPMDLQELSRWHTIAINWWNRVHADGKD